MARTKSSNPYTYYSGGQTHSIKFARLGAESAAYRPMAKSKRFGIRSRKKEPIRDSRSAVTTTLRAQRKRLCGDFPRFHDMSETDTLAAPAGNDTMIIPTETMIVEVGRRSELSWLRNDFGMTVIQEGRRGKCLLQAAEGGREGVRMVFEASRAAYTRISTRVAHPNFLRVVRRPAPATGSSTYFWNLDNQETGNKGIPGADVHALAAWTITEGDSDIRVAVLDEGVDSTHPYLKDAIVDEADFVDGNSTGRPSGDDAHGTACAGIVGSRHRKYRGLAPGVSLIGVRIAKSDNQGFWIFDDFDTADAIDWSWDDARADVLSNSWGGGPPSDAITRAFERARTRGRDGKGSVVVVAAGNDQRLVDFPGNLPNVLTVGASNQWDKRKTRTSADGEYWWGSNYGPGLDVMAPGVKIPTTDIRGGRGYDSTLVTPNFNGTSSACPHVAAAAAMILSIKPGAAEAQVREAINQSADPLVSSLGWDRLTGHGRLNTYEALRIARRTL